MCNAPDAAAVLRAAFLLFLLIYDRHQYADEIKHTMIAAFKGALSQKKNPRHDSAWGCVASVLGF
jgi:hypothetical protein